LVEDHRTDGRLEVRIAEGTAALSVPTKPPAYSTHDSRAAFKLPARSLVPGTLYTATVNALDVSTGLSATTSVTLTTDETPLSAKLSIPSSLHPKHGLTVAWACTDPDGSADDVKATIDCTSGCATKFKSLANKDPEPSAQFAGATWADSTRSNAILRLTCSAGNRTARDTATIVFLTNEQAPSVRVAPTATVVSAGARWGATMYVATPITGSATSAWTNQYRIRWSCLEPCDLDLTDASVAPMGTTSAAFVLAEDVLPAGVYQFVVTLTDRETSAEYNTSTRLSVFPFPTAGEVLVSSRMPGDLTAATVTASGFVAGDPSLEPLRAHSKSTKKAANTATLPAVRAPIRHPRVARRAMRPPAI
jgi:hypothetical protein